MSDFIKPKRVSVPIDEAIRTLLPVSLTKDLHDNEAICPLCHGMGIRVVDNPYGLSDDPDKTAGMFPYKHQSLMFCPMCYNGVIHICPDCGKPIPKGRLKCDCPIERERQYEEAQRKHLEAIQQAEKFDSYTLGGRFKFAYHQLVHSNEGYFSEWEDFFEAWHEYVAECKEANVPVTDRPEYVWAAEPIEMRLDAGSLIEEECEELYEDAIHDISDAAIREMQDYFNLWKYRYGVIAYGEDHRYAIKIPWEEDKE